MTSLPPESFIDHASTRLLASYDRAEPIDPVELSEIVDTIVASAIVNEIARRRVSRGERRRGYKIGFTNRTIWPLYGVDHPIWAPIYDTTVADLAAEQHRVRLRGLLEPRLEPEIVLCLAAPPERADAESVARSLAWVAHGFEIVQSAYPGWRFSGAQSFAAQGLHGRLLIGPRIPASCLADRPAALVSALAGLSLTLFEGRNSDARDRGVGANVLDGPCHAVVHLINELGRHGATLCAGDIITTGTITDAQPLSPGQFWRTEIEGLPGLAGLHLEAC
ncbi:MAG: fumarylacetoacetate hydrolase family protein [Burkholderiaceae bacterium]